MTRGVRADRVGEELSSGRPQGRRPKRGGPRQEGRPWPVKTRLVTVRAAGRGFGLDRLFPRGVSSAGRKVGEGPARCHHPIPVQGLSLSREASVTRAGAACEPHASEADERRARAHARAVRGGDQAIVWACSRVVVVAEVDERRLVQTCKGQGSSSLAPVRGSAGGERAPEAGSRWRKPRAREQRHRWRAPRDPTRGTRKREARQGEGALGDGRRPGPAKGRGL